MSATIEDFATTLAEYEALAISTGEWDGIETPEFSDDGITWSTVWKGEDPPAFARATVHRKGVKIPSTAVIAWAESLPAVDDWRALWERKPMTLFGASAKRAAIRHGFREVIGDRRDPDEIDPNGPTIGATPAPTDRTDWDTQLAEAPDVDALDLVWKDMRADRARTAARELTYHARRTEFVAAAWEPAEPARPAVVVGGRRTGRGQRMQAFIAEQAAEPVPDAAVKETAHEVRRPVPQDHLPGNRAQRRAASRRKGRK